MGTISGALSGGVGTSSFKGIGNFGSKSQGNIIQMVLQALINGGTYLTQSAVGDEKVTIFGFISSLFIGFSGGLLYKASLVVQLYISFTNMVLDISTALLKRLWKLSDNNILV